MQVDLPHKQSEVKVKAHFCSTNITVFSWQEVIHVSNPFWTKWEVFAEIILQTKGGPWQNSLGTTGLMDVYLQIYLSNVLV